MIWYAALEWFGCIKVQRKGVFLSFTRNNTPGIQSSYHMAYVLSIQALIRLLNQTKILKDFCHVLTSDLYLATFCLLSRDCPIDKLPTVREGSIRFGLHPLTEYKQP